MGRTSNGNGAEELVVQLKTELAAVVDVLCVLHDFIDTSFGSKFQQFCESNSDLHEKVKILKSLKSKCSQVGISADSRWNSNQNDDTAEEEETTFSEWPDNVPVVVEDDPLSCHNFAAKCEVMMEADEDGHLDFLEDELNTMNPDPLTFNAVKNPSNNHNAQPKPRPGPSSKKARAHPVILPSPRVSSSSSILINEDDEADEGDRRPRSNRKQSSSLSQSVGYYKCSMCPSTYTNETSLKNHFQYKHSGNRPKVTCHICGITVVDKFRLERHIRIHTGEKPFGCMHCGRKFSRKDYRNQHLKTCVKNSEGV